MRFIAGATLIGLAVLAVYTRTTGYGLFSDDFNWLVGAQVFDARSLLDLSHRSHFFRPVMELYFPMALAVCGRSIDCYHWLSLAIHAGSSLAVAMLAGTLSRTRAIGVLAGLMFAVMPAPVEAVVWVSAVAEVVSAGLFVLTLWSFHRALVSGARRWHVLAFLAFVACLLAHESGVTLLPMLVLSLWLVPPCGPTRRVTRQTLAMLAPFALAWTAYLGISFLVNSRNYVVTEGQYGFGAHVLSNLLSALAALPVARRDTLGLIVLAGFYVWAVSAAPRRIRFFAVWTLVTVMPAIGFHGGLSSRYLYLPAVGFAIVAAEMIWWLRQPLRRWPRAGAAAWWALVILVTLRFAAFATKNARVWQDASAPFSQYAARVRALYPSPPPGARLDVPPPPDAVQPQYLNALLQWEFDDVTLTATVRER